MLHFTRTRSTVADQVEADYGVQSSRFRPMICTVTLGEIRAFSREWPAARMKVLNEILAELYVIDISRDDVIDEYSNLHKYSQGASELAEKGAKGKNIGHNDLWIAAAANAVDAVVLTTDRDFLRLPEGTVRLIQVNSQTGITEKTTA